MFTTYLHPFRCVLVAKWHTFSNTQDQIATSGVLTSSSSRVVVVVVVEVVIVIVAIVVVVIVVVVEVQHTVFVDNPTSEVLHEHRPNHVVVIYLTRVCSIHNFIRKFTTKITDNSTLNIPSLSDVYEFFSMIYS